MTKLIKEGGNIWPDQTKNFDHTMIPGMREYVEFFVSDDMVGPDSPLATYGLVSDPELAATQATIADLK